MRFRSCVYVKLKFSVFPRKPGNIVNWPPAAVTRGWNEAYPLGKYIYFIHMHLVIISETLFRGIFSSKFVFNQNF